MLNWILSLLVIKEVITKEEALYYAKELASTIYSTRFEDAYATIEKMVKKYEAKR